MTYKIGIRDLYLITKSKRDFLLFTLNEDGTKVINFICTDDLRRYRNQYDSFRLLQVVKKENKNTITL